MNQQVKNLLIFLFALFVHKVQSNSQQNNRKDDISAYYPSFVNNYMNYEKGLVYKSLKQLQDSVNMVKNNNHLFGSPSNKKLYSNLYMNLANTNSIFNKNNNDYKNTGHKIKLKRSPRLQLITQMNKEIIKNQMIAYEQFFNKLRRYDSDPMESRQVVNMIRTLFRFPVLLLFSNMFQLPLLPTLILASPFLNNEPGSPNALSNSMNQLANTISKTPIPATVANSIQNSQALQNTFSASASNPQAASSNQIATHLPFSLNPLVPINQLLNNFINEVIGDLQNTPIFNNLVQGFNQMLVKPNRPMQNQLNQPPSQVTATQLLNQNLTKPISGNSTNDTDLLAAGSNASASTMSFAYQEPPLPALSEPLPNIPLIGPVPDENGNLPGNSILNTLASSLLESNKNYQLTESLGVNNLGAISELAMNAVNTLSTMLRIKKQKKDLNSNEEMLLDMLTSKNLRDYLEQVTSIGKLLKFGLKQKMDRDMNICLVKTICESNQKQISFAFEQIFKLAMHLTGMESRIEHSGWDTYYKVGKKMLNEKNVCKLIPRCDEDEESSSGKKLEILEKIERVKKINDIFSRRETKLPDYQAKPFFMKKARKIRLAKRLFNRSFRKADRYKRRFTRFFI